MKLSYKINLIMISILVVMTIAVITAGTVIIGNLALKFQDLVLHSELEKSKQIVTETLSRSGLQAAVRIAGELQADLQRPPHNLKTIQVSIFESPDRVVFHQEYERDASIEWPLLQHMFQQGDGNVEYVQKKHVEYYGVFTTIQPINWLIVHSISKEEIFAERRKYLHNIGIIAIAIFACSAFLVNLVVGRFVGRIQKTLDCIKQIEKGDLKVQIHPISVNDEIGTLQAGVNAMIAKIKQRTFERLKAEQSLRRYEHIISSTNDLMSFVDKNYTYLAVNDAYLRAHDKRREEILGLSVENLIGAEKFQKFARSYLDRALNGENIQYQEWFTYKALGRRFMDVTYYPFRAAHEEEITGVVVAVHDLTHRKQAEREIQKKEEKLRFILDSLPDMIFEVDSSLTILWANKAALDLNSEAMGQTCHTVFPQTLTPCEGCHCFRTFETGNIEMGMMHRPASETAKESYQENIWVPLKDSDGQVSSVITVSRNVTERELSQQRELKLQRDLIHAHKMESIGTLAGGIAHDFNNILSVIIGFTELSLGEVKKGSQLEENLLEVYSAGKRAKDLVAQILTFARQSDEELSPIPIQSIVKEVLKFIRSTLPTTIEIKKNITSASYVMGNATHIHQILMNLCTNASHAMEKTGGVLTVNLGDIVVDKDPSSETTGLENGEYVRIEVSDTGLGIKPEIVDKIFEPYFTTKKPGEGTGMGLAMVHGIVESYHGKIHVSSQPSQGSTFLVFLPIIRTQHEEHLTYHHEDLPSGKERILLVDDEASVVKVWERYLEGLGYSVITRTSSVEALELFKAKPLEFDLVISDITMPNITGDVLAKEMLAVRPDIPVILCTGYTKKISADVVSKIGIKAFVYKPIIKADLAKTVRKVLDADK